MDVKIELPALKKESPLSEFLQRNSRKKCPLLFLVFHVRSGRPLPAQPPAPKGYDWLTPEEKDRECKLPNVLALRIQRRFRALGKKQLTVSSRDGNPQLTQLVYAAGGKHLAVDGEFLAVDPRQKEQLYRDTGELWTWDGTAPSFGPPEYLKELRALIERGSDRPLRRYRRFFFDLDRNTEGTLLQHHLATDELQPRRWNLRMVNRAIEVRFKERLREHVDAPSRCTPFSERDTFREHVQAISDLFMGLLHEHFRSPDGQLDLDAVEDAFEMFAGGELRLLLPDATVENPLREPVWTTQPSSGAYFWFAEFALLAAECGINPELWDRLANVMVRTRHLFCDVYAPLGGINGRMLGDYVGCNFNVDRRPSTRQKQLLREVYHGFEHEDLCRAAADLVAAYAPGEFARVQRRLPASTNGPSEGLHIRALYPPPRNGALVRGEVPTGIPAPRSWATTG